jgi:hypothetical protein
MLKGNSRVSPPPHRRPKAPSHQQKWRIKAAEPAVRRPAGKSRRLGREGTIRWAPGKVSQPVVSSPSLKLAPAPRRSNRIHDATIADDGLMDASGTLPINTVSLVLCAWEVSVVEKEQRRIVETATEARQAEPGPSILLILIVSVVLAAVILGVLWFIFFTT